MDKKTVISNLENPSMEIRKKQCENLFVVVQEKDDGLRWFIQPPKMTVESTPKKGLFSHSVKTKITLDCNEDMVIKKPYGPMTNSYEDSVKHHAVLTKNMVPDIELNLMNITDLKNDAIYQLNNLMSQSNKHSFNISIKSLQEVLECMDTNLVQ